MGEGECDTLLQTRNAAISLLRNSSQLWDLLSQTLAETARSHLPRSHRFGAINLPTKSFQTNIMAELIALAGSLERYVASLFNYTLMEWRENYSAYRLLIFHKAASF